MSRGTVVEIWFECKGEIGLNLEQRGLYICFPRWHIFWSKLWLLANMSSIAIFDPTLCSGRQSWVKCMEQTLRSPYWLCLWINMTVRSAFASLRVCALSLCLFCMSFVSRVDLVCVIRWSSAHCFCVQEWRCENQWKRARPLCHCTAPVMLLWNVPPQLHVHNVRRERRYVNANAIIYLYACFQRISVFLFEVQFSIEHVAVVV